MPTRAAYYAPACAAKKKVTKVSFAGHNQRGFYLGSRKIGLQRRQKGMGGEQDPKSITPKSPLHDIGVKKPQEIQKVTQMGSANSREFNTT